MNRIMIVSGIHFGKPCIAGTRIPVQEVLELLKEGLDFSQIIEDCYPDIKVEEIQYISDTDTHVFTKIQ